VEVAHLPLPLQEEPPAQVRVTTEEGFLEGKERLIALFEREAVARFLGEAKGNVSKAALRAGITRRNFHRLISKYSIKNDSRTSEK
jgi:DNA-binding NtrC family response regulator